MDSRLIELRDMKDFLSKLDNLLQKEQEEDMARFKEGLLGLSEGFRKIQEEEEPPKLEQFKEGLDKLNKAIETAKKNGLWHKTYFNIFEALGCAYNEDIHSNLLAWLLDPEQSHGLKYAFLEKLINKVWGKTISFHGLITVEREKTVDEGRPDIVVDGEGWRLVIENKIRSDERWLLVENEDGSKEWLPQTKVYARPYEAVGGINEKYFLIFMTPNNKKPQSNYFHPISYKTVAELLEELLPNVPGDAQILLKHFIRHIEDHF